MIGLVVIDLALICLASIGLASIGLASIGLASIGLASIGPARRGGAAMLVAAAVCAAAVALGPSGVDAQSPVPEPAVEVPPEDVAAIARNLNCPLCQGYNLQDCPLEVCAQMRELIRVKLAEGQSRDEIVSAFVAEYGPQVLNEPPRRGFFLGAWVLPIVALVVGVIAVVLFVRRSVTAPRAGSGADAQPSETEGVVDEHYARQLEEMAEREDR